MPNYNEDAFRDAASIILHWARVRPHDLTFTEGRNPDRFQAAADHFSRWSEIVAKSHVGHESDLKVSWDRCDAFVESASKYLLKQARELQDLLSDSQDFLGI